MPYFYTLMKALLAMMFITPLPWTKVVVPKSTTMIGVLVNLDKDDNCGVFKGIDILEETTNFTKEVKALGESEKERMRYFNTLVDSLTTLQLRNRTWVCKLQNTLCKIATIIDWNNENLRALINETGKDI